MQRRNFQSAICFSPGPARLLLRVCEIGPTLSAAFLHADPSEMSPDGIEFWLTSRRGRAACLFTSPSYDNEISVCAHALHPLNDTRRCQLLPRKFFSRELGIDMDREV